MVWSQTTGTEPLPRSIMVTFMLFDALKISEHRSHIFTHKS